MSGNAFTSGSHHFKYPNDSGNGYPPRVIRLPMMIGEGKTMLGYRCYSGIFYSGSIRLFWDVLGWFCKKTVQFYSFSGQCFVFECPEQCIVTIDTLNKKQPGFAAKASRQVMVCTRLLNTHINRFETDPVKPTGPQYMF